MLDLTKDVGQGKSRVVGGRTENYLQRISSEVKKTDHQVGWVGRDIVGKSVFASGSLFFEAEFS